MARHKTPTLTQAELRIMKAVWRLKSVSVHDVLQSLPRRERPAYNTILTIMRILEQKGYLRREKAGRAHVYRSLVSRGQARTRAVQQMVHSFFEDSPEQLVLSVLESEKLSPAEVARLKEMIDKRG